MSILDKDWKYNNSTKTARPGYLARRMKLYRKAVQEQRQETEDKVRSIVRKKA